MNWCEGNPASAKRRALRGRDDPLREELFMEQLFTEEQGICP